MTVAAVYPELVVRAVIFDWFGTLAEWPHGSTSSYTSVFSEHGHRVDPAVFDRYHERWDGVDHVEHSSSRETYLAWARQRLTSLATECGVADGARDVLVDSVDRGRPPDVDGGLSRSTRRPGGVAPAGSDARCVLDSGLGPRHRAPCHGCGQALVDVGVTSARVGYRKPHPAIYRSILTALGVAATEAVFVGDSWEPDVLGPIGVGMRSVLAESANG